MTCRSGSPALRAVRLALDEMLLQDGEGRAPARVRRASRPLSPGLGFPVVFTDVAWPHAQRLQGPHHARSRPRPSRRSPLTHAPPERPLAPQALCPRRCAMSPSHGAFLPHPVHVGPRLGRESRGVTGACGVGHGGPGAADRAVHVRGA